MPHGRERPPREEGLLHQLQQGRSRAGQSGSRGTLKRQAATASRFRRGISEPAATSVLEMDRAIEECDRVLAVLSPDYVASLFTRPEWAAYFKEDPTSEQRQILRLGCATYKAKKGLLAAIVYVDLVGERRSGREARPARRRRNRASQADQCTVVSESSDLRD